jgi:hypothetical protein
MDSIPGDKQRTATGALENTQVLQPADGAVLECRSRWATNSRRGGEHTTHALQRE